MALYTISERAAGIYKIASEVFNWKRSSDCVTPLDLARQQIQGRDPSGTVCVPGAGIGTYIVAALGAGFKPQNIYAVEIDPAYYELGAAIYRRFGVNYVLADFLTWRPNMQFDAVIGNPPYQGGDFGKSVYKSLWPLFWAKSLELAKEDGYVSLITPNTWCGPSRQLAKRDAVDGKCRLWDVFDSYTSVADVTTVKAFFPGVGSTFSLVSVDKSGRDGLSFTDGFSGSLGFYPNSGAEQVQRELSLSDNIRDTLSMGKPRNGEKWRVSYVCSRHIRENTTEVIRADEFPASGLHESLYGYIYCATEAQAVYVRERLLECRDIYNKHARWHGFIDSNVVGMTTIPNLPTTAGK